MPGNNIYIYIGNSLTVDYGRSEWRKIVIKRNKHKLVEQQQNAQ